jgi:hypothetical protein
MSAEFGKILQQKLNAPEFQGPALARRGGGAGAAPSGGFKVDHGVFVLYKPVEACARCRARLESDAFDPDAEDAYECPHNKRAAYLEIVQKCHDGGWTMLAWREETLKNGTVQISMSWGVPKNPEPKKTKELLSPKTVPSL